MGRRERRRAVACAWQGSLSGDDDDDEFLSWVLFFASLNLSIDQAPPKRTARARARAKKDSCGRRACDAAHITHTHKNTTLNFCWSFCFQAPLSLPAL